MMKSTLTALTILTFSLAAQTAAAQGAAAPRDGNDAVLLLYNQLTNLQEEMQTLRAMVEEQSFEIRRLQRDTRDRYADLDSRLSSLYQRLESNAGGAPSQGAAAPGGQSQAPGGRAATAPSQPEPVPVSSGEDLPDPSGMSEQQLYQFALDTLLQNEAYRQAVEAFDLYLQEYPDGRYVTNAHYWKGQAFVNLSLMEQARDSFETIVNDYPDGRKIDDAMYSLGTVYDQLGNTSRARELLQDVIARFPNTSAANLADIYLRSLN